MSERPHIASVLAVAVLIAALVNFAILYVVTSRPRAEVDEVVLQAPIEGHAVERPRPKAPVEKAARRGDLDKDLRLAAAGPDPAAAKALIAAGAKVNSVGAGRETPLHAAASGGRTGIVQVLLQAGADVNARDEDGHTPLHTAAAWGHVELTGLLIAAGSDPNAVDNHRETPLHLVAGRPVPPLSVYARVTRMLLAAGARPNLRTTDGDTALHLARHSASRLSLESNVKATGDANEVVSLLRDRGGIE